MARHKWAALHFGERRCCSVCGIVQSKRTISGTTKWLPKATPCKDKSP